MTNAFPDLNGGQWPDLGNLPAAPPVEPPPTWVWAAMEPADRQERLRDVAIWVGWLVETHHLQTHIPACWYQHPPLVEILTALYLGWVRAYAPDAEPAGPAELDWIEALHRVLPLMKTPTCTNGHRAPPPRAWDHSGLGGWLSTAPLMQEKAVHPAAAELARREAATAALEGDIT